MNTTYLLLGSNEGNKLQWLQQAEDLLQQNCGVIHKRSSFYETAAWGLENQPDFLNRVILIETALAPTDLLNRVQGIEKQLGRQRDVKWGQRTLDIDILLYNDEIIQLPELVVPHPYMAERRFTLAPLCEIAPTLLHPVLKQTIAQLYALCPDPLQVNKIPTPA